MISEGFGLVLFSLIVFTLLFLAVGYNFFKVRKIKTVRNSYLMAVITSLCYVLAFLFLLFEQIPLFLIFFFVVGPVCVVVAWVKYGKVTVSEQAKKTKEVIKKDKNKKLTFFDVFTAKGWVKIALKFGTIKATILSFVIALIVSFLLFLLLKQIGYTESIFEVMTNAIFTSVLAAGWIYFTTRKIKK